MAPGWSTSSTSMGRLSATSLLAILRSSLLYGPLLTDVRSSVVFHGALRIPLSEISTSVGKNVHTRPFDSPLTGTAHSMGTGRSGSYPVGTSTFASAESSSEASKTRQRVLF